MNAYQPGDTLGRYRIERPLGQGAMGEVYLARDPQIDRLLAVKTLRLVGVREEEVEERQARMLREARTAGRLIHPHIVTLFDAGEQDGLLFLAFEYVPGSDLAVRLASGPLPVGEALRICREACEGLGHAHREGIVHRDVKPSNLLLDAHGSVKISDFGIAKLGGEATELTVTGMVMGSPHYMSPEQIRGEELDGRSDLFSLGIVLYEALSGRRPFAGDTISTLVFQIVGSEPQPLAALRPGLEPLPALLSRLLAKDRQARFPDAAAVGAEIAALEAALPAALLAAPAVLVTAPTDATVVMPESGGTGSPSALVPASAAAGTPAQADAPAAAAPAAVSSAVTPLPPTLSGPGAVPPPPPPAAAAAGPAMPPDPRSAAGLSMPPPPAAGPSAASGGSYAVPSLSGAPRRGLLIGVAVLAVLALVVVGGLALLRPQRGDGEPVAGGEQALPAAGLGGDAGEEGEATPTAADATPTDPSAPVRTPEAGAASPSASRSEPHGGADVPRSGTSGGAAARQEPTRTPPPGTRPAAGGSTTAGRGDTGASGAPGSGAPGSGAPGSGAQGRGAQDGGAQGSAPPGSSSAASAAPRTPPSGAPAEPSPRTLSEPDAGGSSSRGDDGAAAGPIVDTGMTLIFEVRPPDAFVLLDGTVIGRAAEYGRVSRRPFVLPSPGIHRITLRRDGMEDYQLRVRAAADGPLSPIRVHMEPLDATDTPLSELETYRVREAVAFKIEPPNARLMVDGEAKGLANRWSGGRFRRDGWLELPLGIHRLSLIAPGRRRVDLAVDVTAGASEGRRRIEIVLPPLRADGGR